MRIYYNFENMDTINIDSTSVSSNEMMVLMNEPMTNTHKVVQVTCSLYYYFIDLVAKSMLKNLSYNEKLSHIIEHSITSVPQSGATVVS